MKLLVVLAAALSVHVQAHAAGNGDVAAGRALYASRCASCHSVGPSARGGFGPHLNGVLGRPAASTRDFSYSPALGRSGIVWTEKTLAAFLRDPGEVVPGTKMRFSGLRSEKQIADLLAHLRSVK